MSAIMAASTTNPDPLNDRAAIRQRPGLVGLRDYTQSPRSPRTPILGRSISQPFGSPGSFRVEQEDILIYELSPRYFSAGFAGESQPRCILPFNPDGSRRIGDSRQHVSPRRDTTSTSNNDEAWGTGYELFKLDLHDIDLGLVEDRLDRALRKAMVEYLQLDAKPRKAVLVLPSMLPTPLLDVALRVLFGHFTLPPSITLLTRPAMSCVGAGLRHGLVIDIGWEYTDVVAVSEYKQIAHQHSIRAGRMLTKEMAGTLQRSIRNRVVESALELKLTFGEAEDITQRFAWCYSKQRIDDKPGMDEDITLSTISSNLTSYSVSFSDFAEPAEKTFFASDVAFNEHDDHDLPIHLLAYHILLMLPVDVRALCISRIIVMGDSSHLPGLNNRMLQEITHLVDVRGWDPVSNYGSAKPVRPAALRERSANVPSTTHAEQVRDDVKDPVTLKVDRESAKGRIEPVKGIVRGVKTLGPWAGASLAAALRIKGAHEVEREDFLKHGLRNGIMDT